MNEWHDYTTEKPLESFRVVDNKFQREKCPVHDYHTPQSMLNQRIFLLW